MNDYRAIQVGGHRANSQRFAALVDEADVEAVSAYRWSINAAGYARRTVYVEGKLQRTYLHRFILDLVPGEGQVDHINGDRLDNRRANLRVCTNAQNSQNLHDRPYRGTYWHAQGKCWVAKVYLNGKPHYLGVFDTREEAAIAAASFRRKHMPFSLDARIEEAQTLKE